MNEMRRNEDAMKRLAGVKKINLQPCKIKIIAE